MVQINKGDQSKRENVLPIAQNTVSGGYSSYHRDCTSISIFRYLRIWTLHFSQLDLGIFSIFSSIGIVNFEHISPCFFFLQESARGNTRIQYQELVFWNKIILSGFDANKSNQVSSNVNFYGMRCKPQLVQSQHQKHQKKV